MRPTARRIGVRSAAAGGVILGLVATLSVAPISSMADSSSGDSSTESPSSGKRAGGAGQKAQTAAQQLPDSFEWSSTDPVISPAEGLDSVAAKDPSVLQDEDGTWHVFFTKVDTSGDWGLAHTSFDDWSEAGSAPQVDLEAESGIGSGYRAAPNAFYFEPADEWYLVYQDGLPAYSTTDDINDPSSWSEPQHFLDSVPPVVEENIGDGSWLDFFVTCDDSTCHLFSADDNGHVYRTETSIDDFPNGWGETEIVLEDENANNLFEGGAVYQLEGSDSYLLLWEAIGSDGRRYYRSFTSDALDREWQPLAATEENPFARSNNVSFESGNAWTQDISHGELIRTSNDQSMTVDPCNLQLLYQGMDPEADDEYSQLPWRLGLATATNTGC